MSAHNEQPVNNWWAEGDTPVHADSHVTYLVDAHSAFLSMCRHFLMARKYIYIAAWGLTPLMELVRGADQRAGPDGSPEQEALLAELNGDYDRWDTHSHHYSSPMRRNQGDRTPHNWHDAHAVIEGPAVGDVELNFRQRWNDVVQRHEWDNQLLVPEHPLPPPLESTSLVQVARTIPAHTYSFAPVHGIQDIAQLYANALSNAQHFVYLENQYFWIHAFYGIDHTLLRIDSPDMERNLHALAAALRRGTTVAMVLPDHPNVGRDFTDAGLAHLSEDATEAAAQGRIQVFCLA